MEMDDFLSEYPRLEDIHRRTKPRRPPLLSDELLEDVSSSLKGSNSTSSSVFNPPNDTPISSAIHSQEEIGPFCPDAKSNTLSLPENPFYDQAPMNGSSVVPHMGLEYPVFPFETQIRMMNIQSYEEEWEGIFRQFSLSPNGDHQTYRPVSTKVHSLAKTRRGSAELKQKIFQNNPPVLSQIVSEVEGHIYELIFDQFGSSFLQTLFESMADEYIERMLRELLSKQERLKSACMHNFGNMTVIKLIRRLKSPYCQFIFTNGMKKLAMALTKSTLGIEVLNECFYVLSRPNIQMLMKEVVENCFEVAADKVGCYILQSCMTHGDHNTICDLLRKLGKDAVILSEDAYGNYVVQRAVDLVKEGYAGAGILCQLEGHYVDMSMNKFASNVVEKCINDFPEAEAIRVLREIMDSPRFVSVCQNAFGNYVLQCALKKFTGSILEELIDRIDENSTALKSHPHSRRVVKAAKARRAELSKGRNPTE